MKPSSQWGQVQLMLPGSIQRHSIPHVSVCIETLSHACICLDRVAIKGGTLIDFEDTGGKGDGALVPTSRSQVALQQLPAAGSS